MLFAKHISAIYIVCLAQNSQDPLPYFAGETWWQGQACADPTTLLWQSTWYTVVCTHNTTYHYLVALVMGTIIWLIYVCFGSHIVCIALSRPFPHRWKQYMYLYHMTRRAFQCISTLIDRLAEAGHKVVGVEIVEKAVKGFFSDNHLPYEEKQIGSLVRYRVRLWNTTKLFNIIFLIIHMHQSIFLTIHTQCSHSLCYYSSRSAHLICIIDKNSIQCNYVCVIKITKKLHGVQHTCHSGSATWVLAVGPLHYCAHVSACHEHCHWYPYVHPWALCRPLSSI